jgi:hypothetical protein
MNTDAALTGHTRAKRVLVIDDVRSFSFPAVYARTVREAEPLLFAHEWDEVWLDHDLGLLSAAPTVMPLVNKMERLAYEGTVLPITTVFVHTANPVGRRNIIAALDRWYTLVSVDANDYLDPRSPSLMFRGTANQ